MAILALYSQKGGVGKTAAAVNLAYEAAQSGLRVLLCDLDPQGAASFFFRVKPRLKRKARGLAKAHRAIAASIKATDYPGLNLLPADFSHRNLDLVLGDRKKPARRLRRTFKPLEKEHDLILLDCPPTMSLFAENILTVADAVLVPLVPTTLSLRSHRQLLAFAHDSLQKPAPIHAFFSMVEGRRKLHREIQAAVEESDAALLETRIPYRSVVERMGIERQPVAGFAPRSDAARAYRTLWQEVSHTVLGISPTHPRDSQRSKPTSKNAAARRDDLGAMDETTS